MAHVVTLEVEVPARPDVVRLALRESGGAVLLEARRGSGFPSVLLTITPDGRLVLAQGIERDLGLDLDGGGRLAVS